MILLPTWRVMVPKKLTITKDTTRVIAKANYDCIIDRVVGFVLPCGDAGIPLSDTFFSYITLCN